MISREGKRDPVRRQGQRTAMRKDTQAANREIYQPELLNSAAQSMVTPPSPRETLVMSGDIFSCDNWPAVRRSQEYC